MKPRSVEASSAPVSAAPPKPDYKAVWPVALLLASTGVLSAGLVYGLSRAPKDDPAAPLVPIRALVQAGEHEKAIAELNSKLVPPLQRGLLNQQQEIEFFLLRARSLAEGQSKLGLSVADNHRAILADYAQARKLKAEFDDADLSRIAIAHVELGQLDQALAEAKGFSANAWPLRSAILKAVARLNLKARKVNYEQTLGVLSELETSPKSSPGDRVWALIRQAELRLAMDFHDEAITRLLRAIPMLDEVDPQRRAELLRLLGKAYFEVGRTEEAMTQLEASLTGLAPSDSDREEAELLIGRLLQTQGRHDEAAQRMNQLIGASADGGSPGSGGPIIARARFTLAESTAALGEDLDSARQYESVIDAMRGKAAEREFSLTTVGHALLSRAADRASRDQHQVALMYADLSRKAFIAANVPVEKPKALTESEPSVGKADEHGGGHNAAPAAHGDSDAASPEHAIEHGDAHSKAQTANESNAAAGLRVTNKQGVPAAVFVISADAHRRIAELTLAEARQSEAGLLRIDQISPVSALEVKRHYLDAGADYREHAGMLVTADPAASASSLWMAADCYDLAGDRDAARDAFQSYSAGAADNDPRKSEARYRLAQVLQAQGELIAAAAQYRIVMENRNAGDSGGSGTGLIADRSLVPLARCLLDDKDPTNDAEAETLLRTVLSGATFSPDAAEYREAIIELGEHLHRTARFTEAASSLEEARKRYPEADEAVRVNFKLADCYRQSAAQIGDELKAALPQDRRDQLLQLRRNRLLQAGELFGQVGRTLAARDIKHTTQLDRVMQRNASFYQADAAYDLGDDDSAIKLYDAAAQRFSTDPASLLARVQIVSCYLRQGKPAEAAAANLRAKRQLAGIPTGAFDQPDMPMTRKHWERWLAADTQLRADAQPP